VQKKTGRKSTRPAKIYFTEGTQQRAGDITLLTLERGYINGKCPKETRSIQEGMAREGYGLIDEDNSTTDEDDKRWMTDKFIKETRSRQKTRWTNLSTAKANLGIDTEKQVMIRNNMKEDPCARFVHHLTHKKSERKRAPKGNSSQVAMKDEKKNIDRHQILAMIKKQDREEKGEKGHTIAIWVDPETTTETTRKTITTIIKEPPRVRRTRNRREQWQTTMTARATRIEQNIEQILITDERRTIRSGETSHRRGDATSTKNAQKKREASRKAWPGKGTG
jgi:hypothetical protein